MEMIPYLNKKENAVVLKLAEHHGMSCAGVMRQAIRLYQSVQVELENGNTLGFYDANGERVVKRAFGLDLLD